MGVTEYNLPQRVLEDITVFAQKYNVDKMYSANQNFICAQKNLYPNG